MKRYNSNADEDRHGNFVLYDDAQAELAQLKAALWKYGYHITSECGAGFPISEHCTCGFSDALRKFAPHPRAD